MISSNYVTMLIFLCIFTLLIYRSTSQKEPFINVPMTSKINAVDPRTQTFDQVATNKQYGYARNPTINENVLYPGAIQNLQSAVSTVQNATLPAQNPYSAIVNNTSEGFENPRNTTPVFQVPGYQQSYLSPRQSSTGFSSFIRYNIPTEKNLAVRANDPLMMRDSYCNPVKLANMVQPVKENFDNSDVVDGMAVSPQYAKLYKSNLESSNQVISNNLPITSMANSIGNENDPNIVNYNMYTFALQRDRLNGLGCPIRGDVPCTPCLSTPDPSSNTWFRPPVNPSTALRTGAINVIAGATNVTAMQTAELAARGTSKNTFAGVAIPYPIGSPMANLQQAQQAALTNLNMANDLSQTTSYSSPTNTVNTSIFA